MEKGLKKVGEVDHLYFFELAIQDLKQAIALTDHRNPLYLSNLGFVYSFKSDWPNTHKFLDMALSIDKDNPVTFHGKGFAYQQEA